MARNMMNQQVLVLLVLLACAAHAAVQRFVVKPHSNTPSSIRYLFVEFSRDDIVHFEASGIRDQPPDSAVKDGMFASIMVDKRDYPGPSAPVSVSQQGSATVFSTSQLRVEVDLNTLAARVIDTVRQPELLLTTFTYAHMGGAIKSLQLASTFTQNVYGLGERYMEPYGSTDGDFFGRDFTLAPDTDFGNSAWPIQDNDQWRGMSELANFPILYAAGPGTQSYAVFVDNLYRKEWHLSHDPWSIDMWGDQIRWYVFRGDSLAALRGSYMELVGHPLVPPKRYFGMFQSIFGYRSWSHANVDIDLLTAPNMTFHRFPVDAVAFDIYWFGGKFYGDASVDEAKKSTMGSLHWDPINFPDPINNVHTLRNKGADVFMIQESYVSMGTPAFGILDSKGMLVKDCATCGSTILGENGENHWWGVGGMMDWSNDAASSFWFDCKLCPLLEQCPVDVTRCGDMLADRVHPTAMQAGAVGFWLDLGEPEMFHANAWYSGWVDDDGQGRHAHGDYHNLHQLLWTKSIADGYARHSLRQRPWTLSRSGTSGLHRYGASMWSGDIWPALENMASSLALTKHMSMVGIDYFGSDVGGFERKFLEQDEDAKYTQWFANSAWFDVPLRPHAWQPDGSTIETAPCRVGDLNSNLFNVRQRYELVPYYYSLAHRAHQFAEPVFPPLFYYYPTDAHVRSIGHEKLIGRDILVGVVAALGQTQRDVYLPADTWVNYFTNEYIQSPGQTIPNLPNYIHRPDYCSSDPNDRCIFALPVFVRAGALLPKMHVDANTKNTLGERWVADDLAADMIVHVFTLQWHGAPANSKFTLYEDDGVSVDYQHGGLRTTLLTQQTQQQNCTITISAARGDFVGAPTKRRVIVKAVFASWEPVQSILLNGVALKQVPDVTIRGFTVGGLGQDAR